MIDYQLIANWAGELRKSTFVDFCRLAEKYQLKNILETGCIRREGENPDGQSTLILAYLAKNIGGKVISVDIEWENIERCSNVLRSQDLLNYVTFVKSDSVKYLSENHMSENFDAIYLDSSDFFEDDPLPSQIHQLAEVKHCIARKGKKIVMLDDCDLKHGGKGALSSKFLSFNYFIELRSGYQKLFSNFWPEPFDLTTVPKESNITK